MAELRLREAFEIVADSGDVLLIKNKGNTESRFQIVMRHGTHDSAVSDDDIIMLGDELEVCLHDGSAVDLPDGRGGWTHTLAWAPTDPLSPVASVTFDTPMLLSVIRTADHSPAFLVYTGRKLTTCLSRSDASSFTVRQAPRDEGLPVRMEQQQSLSPQPTQQPSPPSPQPPSPPHTDTVPNAASVTEEHTEPQTVWAETLTRLQNPWVIIGAAAFFLLLLVVFLVLVLRRPTQVIVPAPRRAINIDDTESLSSYITDRGL